MDQGACLGVDDVEIDKDDVNINGPPMSAAQYLRRVKAERQAVSDVVRIKKAQRSTSPEVKRKKQWLESVGWRKEDGNHETASTLIPTAEWQHEKCRQFGAFREKIAEKMKRSKPIAIKALKSPEEEEWHEILLEKCLPQFQNVTDSFPNHTGTPPTIQMVFAIPNKHISQLIEYLVEWSSEEGLSRPIREWIYSLLLIVDLPLVQDLVSALRTLVKDCKKLRSQLSSDRKSEAYEYSLFIAIVGIYFGQKDLADNT